MDARRCAAFFVLVDSRHGMKDSDAEVMTMLDKAGVSYRVVLTKIDKADDLEAIKVSVGDALKKTPGGIPGDLRDQFRNRRRD